MIWRNGVQWNIAQDPDPKAFMTVDAGDYVLAVPDFAQYARIRQEVVSAQAQEQAIRSQQHEQKLKKVIMKLSGKVRWQLGMVFERDVEDGKRSFDFIPHYQVVTRNPVHIKQSMKVSRHAGLFGSPADILVEELRCVPWIPQQSYSYVYRCSGSR